MGEETIGRVKYQHFPINDLANACSNSELGPLNLVKVSERSAKELLKCLPELGAIGLVWNKISQGVGKHNLGIASLNYFV